MSDPIGRVDLAFAAVVFLLGAGVGAAYVRVPEVARGAMFYQDDLSPAVTFACGRGLVDTDAFVNSGSRGGLALRAFLRRESDGFDCAQLPAVMPPAPLTAFQAASRYLMLTLGVVWKVRGIAWSALTPLYAVLFGSVCGTAFLIFRCGMNRVLSAAATLVFMTSPLHLSTLPHLRDYAKAPFFVVMTAVLALLALREASRRALVAWSAFVGAVLGFGFGIRFDVETYLAFFVVATVLFVPGCFRSGIHARLAAAGACLAAFVIVAAPILIHFELGRNAWHVILLGLADPHDQALGVQPSVYRLGSLYYDSLIWSTVNAYWSRVHGATAIVSLTTPEYAAASSAYYRALATTFPADIVVRAWAAVLQTLVIPFGALPTGMLPGVHDATIAMLYTWRGNVLRLVGSLAPWVSVAAVLLLARTNLRRAILVAAFVIFFGGLASLQFQLRHVFALELVAWWLIGTGIQLLMTLPREAPGRGWLRAAAFCATLLAIALVPVKVLRAYQQPRVASLLRSYDAAATVTLPLDRQPTAGDAVRFALNRLPAPHPVAMPSQLLVAEFGGVACDFDHVSATIRYSPAAGIDFSRTIDLQIPARTVDQVQLLMPVYGPPRGAYQPQFRPVGLELPRQQAACLERLRAPADPAVFPIFIHAVLPPDWSSERLFETVDGLETSSSRLAMRRSYVVPPGREFGRHLLARLEPLAAIDYLSPIVSVPAPGKLAVSGFARGASAYLASWRPIHTTSNDYLLVEGELDRGGVQVGLVADNRWAGQTAVEEPGRFRVVIQAPSSDDVAPVIASHVAGRFSRNTLTIDRIGWIHDDGQSRIE